VRLAGTPEADSPPFEGPLPTPAGLAFDPWCRLFRSLPEEGRIERLLNATADPLVAQEHPPEVLDLFAPAASAVAGDFGVPAGGALDLPRGLAVDAGGRLYIAESGAARLVVFDLAEGRLLRRVPFRAHHDVGERADHPWRSHHPRRCRGALAGRIHRYCRGP
jgi:hypothetical protein